MMIKRRLAISNLLMIALPVLFTCVITAVCLGALFLTLLLNDSPIMADRYQLEDTSEMVADALEEALEANEDTPTENSLSIDDIAHTLSRQGLVLRVTDEDGKVVYAGGDFNATYESLFQAASALTSAGSVEMNDHVAARAPITANGHTYQCYVFGTDNVSAEEEEHYWETLTLLVIGVMAVAVIVSIFLTNRFLIHFIFRRIEEPLDILAAGVQEIAAGNLDYRIRYTDKDEFAPICSQFNEMAARLKQSVDDIQRHEESRKELMASISHDLRSPLTAIQAYVEGLLDGVANTPEKQQRYLETIKAKSEDIAHMVSQIFLYSKMDLEEFPLHAEPFALKEELDALTAVITPEYAAKGLVITADPVPVVTVHADSEMLRRILMNIVDNSLKYKTTDIGHLHLHAEEAPRTITLTLTDDGPGVPEEAVDKLFDVFYRSDPSRHNPKQGSGLGLAIANKAITRMGGSIHADNVQPHGLAITLTLPKGDASDGKNTDY